MNGRFWRGWPGWTRVEKEANHYEERCHKEAKNRGRNDASNGRTADGLYMAVA